VQVGDPFAEKLLIEATLELMASGAVAAIQDMGAAGLTSSSVEMAGKGGVGIELDLDAVPQRETGMTAYEMMLSESQERMLAILKPGREADGQRIFAKWGLDAATIGHTTDTGRIVLRHKGEVVCDLPLAPLSDDAPLYDRPWAEPVLQPRLDPADVPPPEDWAAAVLKVMGCPDMASKRWIWEQYDRHVMADTLADSATAADAAIVRVHGTRKALAMTSDVTPRYVAADPTRGQAGGGGGLAQPDSRRGGPDRHHRQPQLRQPRAAGDHGPDRPRHRGHGRGVPVLDFPVVSGNVSLYNETSGVGIPPTPTVGAVGLLPDYAKRMGFGGLRGSHRLVLVGRTSGELGSSTYLREVLGRDEGAPPPVDLEVERRNGDFVRRAVRAPDSLIRAVHDLSDGGLIVAACEMAFANDAGLELEVDKGAAVGFLFGEDQSRYLLAVDHRDETAFSVLRKEADAAGVPFWIVGWLHRSGPQADDLHLHSDDGEFNMWTPIDALRAAHEGWMPGWMAGPA
jgi:phosphoribosylformylglycinamidine synthase